MEKWKYPGSRESATNCSCTLQNATYNRLKRLLESGAVPPRFHAYSFETWANLPANQRAGKESMLKLCRAFAAFEGPPSTDSKLGVVLSGPVGRGKTGLASCVLLQRARRGQVVLWVDFSQFLRRVRNTYNAEIGITYEDVVGAAANAPFLFIDDMGDVARKADITDHTRDVMYDVVSERYNNLREMLVTTNLDIDSFRDQFGDRIADRIQEMCHWQTCGGENLRAIA